MDSPNFWYLSGPAKSERDPWRPRTDSVQGQRQQSWIAGQGSEQGHFRRLGNRKIAGRLGRIAIRRSDFTNQWGECGRLFI